MSCLLRLAFEVKCSLVYVCVCVCADFIPLAVLLQKNALTSSSSSSNNSNSGGKRSVKFASTATIISPDETDGMTGGADISSAPLKEADSTPSYSYPPPPDFLAPPVPPIVGPYIPAYIANNPLAMHLQPPTSTQTSGVGSYSGAPPAQSLPPAPLSQAPVSASGFQSNGDGGASFLANGGATQPQPPSVPLVRPVPPPVASKPTGFLPQQSESAASAFVEQPARQQQQMLLPYEREVTFRLDIRLMDGSTTYGFRLRGGAEFASKVFKLNTCNEFTVQA